MGDRLGLPRVVDGLFYFFKKSSDIASPCTTAMVSGRRGGPPCAEPPMPMADDLNLCFSLIENGGRLRNPLNMNESFGFRLLTPRCSLRELC